jgi:hypothetical protein
VNVSLEMDGPRAQVTVTDHEPGLAPEFLPVAFEQFTRAALAARGLMAASSAAPSTPAVTRTAVKPKAAADP